MKTYLKKIFLLLSVLIMISGILIGCDGGNKSNVSTGESTVTSYEDLPNIEIRISGCNSMEHPQTLGLSLFKTLIEEETGGKIQVKIYPNSQLGAERESVEQVKNGTLEMATASAGPLTTFDKTFMLMDIPFLFDTYEEAWAALDGPAGKILFDSLETVGLKGLAYMENGFRHVTNNDKPITKPEDLKGLKIRTMEAPMHMENFTSLGANPTPVPFSELYMSMSQGIVDGQENPLANIWEVNMFEVQKYTSLTGHIYDAMPIVTNLEWFNKLPAEYQALIEKYAVLGANYSRFINASREDEIIQALESKGMKVNELTIQEKEAFKNASQSNIIDNVKNELTPEKVDEFLQDIILMKEDITKGL